MRSWIVESLGSPQIHWARGGKGYLVQSISFTVPDRAEMLAFQYILCEQSSITGAGDHKSTFRGCKRGSYAGRVGYGAPNGPIIWTRLPFTCAGVFVAYLMFEL